MTKLIQRRLHEVKSVSCLHELLRPGFPGNWHDLKGDRKGQFSANLFGASRFICLPDGDQAAYMGGDSIDTKKVVALHVFDIVDYH